MTEHNCDLCGGQYDERLPRTAENATVRNDDETKCITEDAVFVHDEHEGEPLHDPDDDANIETFTFSTGATR